MLSLFASLNLHWPSEVVQLFKYAALFTANVEVTSPECSVSVGYISKWYFFELMPFLVFAFGATVHFCSNVAVRLKARRRGVRPRLSSPNTLIGVYLIAVSYYYIFLVKNSFDALKCTHVGKSTVLAVDPSVNCGTEEYKQMRNWALVAVIAYGVGIPVLLGWCIAKHATEIQLDQSLRIRGLAGARETNPYYDMQKK